MINLVNWGMTRTGYSYKESTQVSYNTKLPPHHPSYIIRSIHWSCAVCLLGANCYIYFRKGNAESAHIGNIPVQGVTWCHSDMWWLGKWHHLCVVATFSCITAIGFSISLWASWMYRNPYMITFISWTLTFHCGMHTTTRHAFVMVLSSQLLYSHECCSLPRIWLQTMHIWITDSSNESGCKPKVSNQNAFTL